MSDAPQLLLRAEQGDRLAAEELLPLVYAELRRLAAQQLAGDKASRTLDATALVHEAYLRLAGGATPQQWHGRGHFFAAAAESMRRILVDRARRRNSLKRGGGRTRVDLDASCSVSTGTSQVDMLALDEALTRLAAHAPAKAELVKLRYFAGLTTREAAQAMDISVATAERYWVFARSWLYAELDDSRDGKTPHAQG